MVDREERDGLLPTIGPPIGVGAPLPTRSLEHGKRLPILDRNGIGCGYPPLAGLVAGGQQLEITLALEPAEKAEFVGPSPLARPFDPDLPLAMPGGLRRRSNLGQKPGTARSWSRAKARTGSVPKVADWSSK